MQTARGARYKTPMPGGRPSGYTPEIALEICERMSHGETVRKICADAHMPHERTVRGWNFIVPEFAPLYARARELQADALADQVIDVADDIGLTPEDRRLMTDSRKWAAAKFSPKRYGDRTTVAGDPDAPLVVTDTRPDMAVFLAEWAAAKKGAE